MPRANSMCIRFRKSKNVIINSPSGKCLLKSKQAKTGSPLAKSPTNKSLLVASAFPLLDHDVKSEFKEAINAEKQQIASYHGEVRKIYRQKSLSLSSVPFEEFTETIQLKSGDELVQALSNRGYRLDKRIGQGGYGLVYRCYYMPTGKILACKTINLRRTNRHRMVQHLRTEIFIMERYPHPNIITILDHFIIEDVAYIMMEIADSGSLSDLVLRHGAMKELIAHAYFIQIFQGLFYLHRCNIAHRDLKLDNVLLFSQTNSNLPEGVKLAKLTDFGLSQAAYRPKEGRIKTGNFGGTRSYMAPEILRLEVFEEFEEECDLDYDPFKSDVWALGLCLYELLTAVLPFDSYRDLKKIYWAQMECTWGYPNLSLSELVKNLIRAMLEPKPEVRIDPIGIAMHHWTQFYLTKQGKEALNRDVARPPPTLPTTN